ncbi:MAG TPA: apolipoprotein N-acyltransferase [Acidimicrobiia bacterium]
MKTVLLALAGAAVSVLAFPPFGPGLLIIPGIALFLVALRTCRTRMQGLWIGGVYGVLFFGGLMWWLGELDPLALVLVPVQAVFFAIYGWWLAGRGQAEPTRWYLGAVGGWALMEVIRYRFPVGGQEWGAAGYALSDNLYVRLPASAVGTSGLTVIVVLLAAMAALGLTRHWDSRIRWAAVVPVLVVAATVPSVMTQYDAGPFPVAIVQGSTPCPFEDCPPNERLRTFEQHLALTETIRTGTVELVVWPESSTGSTNADPMLNDEIREAIAEQARRIEAAILIGGDRIVNDDEFVNANVFFDAEGEIVGEYRKQHPVPFGEYIPSRPWFEWIPALDQVPRDMIPGEGPVVFDMGMIELGSVISWEGGFSRYALQHRRAGANVLAVTTNKASYGPDAPTSDQFIGMTRMRAVELGVPVIHAAVTGKSTIVDYQGSFDATTETGESVIVYGDAGLSTSTIYSSIGDTFIYLAALVGLYSVWRMWTLVGSDEHPHEED